MRTALIRISLPVMLLLTAVPAAQAQVRVTIDNDLFGPRGAGEKPPDYEYTHGTRISWRAKPLSPLRRLIGGGDSTWLGRFEVGQEIYTPRHDAAEPLPGERLYAGWLYASATAERVRGRGARSLSIGVGVTGRPSLAEPVQTTLHRIAGYRAPLGWRHQLPFEPGLVVRYRESLSVVDAGDARRTSFVLAPEWGAAAGNVRTAADAGLRASVGWRAWPDSGGKPRRSGFGVYALGGARQVWVARDVFLDGSTFRGGPRVSKLPWVRQADVGIGVRTRRAEVRYQAVWRGREYRTQDEPHRWGSITLIIHPRTP